MFAPMLNALNTEYAKVATLHFELRQQEVTMQTSRAVLEDEIRKVLELKLVLDIQIQALREAEWQAYHPQRQAATQVCDFQLEPERLTLPIVMEAAPASPDPEPATIPLPMAPPAVAPVARQTGRRGRGRAPIAVVRGYSPRERAFIDNVL